MSESINDQIAAIFMQSMADSDERRDEIVRQKLASAQAAEQAGAFWSSVAGWGAVVAAVGLVVTLVLLLLGSA
jgi:anti-sigma-K factor RskA